MKKGDKKKLYLDFSQLRGQNAHLIMASFKDEALKANWSQEEVKQILDDMMSSDYEHLWEVLCLYSETPDNL